MKIRKQRVIVVLYWVWIGLTSTLLGSCGSIDDVLNNDAPDVDAGSDQLAGQGDTVRLVGNFNDSDGFITEANWLQIEGPTVELTQNAILVDEDEEETVFESGTVDASFTVPTVDVETLLGFRFLVWDNDNEESSDDVFILVGPGQAPVVTGKDQIVMAGDTVFLDGSTSFDVDGSIASYLWQQIGGTAIELQNADQSSTTFTAPQVTQALTLSFHLTVTDDDGLTGSARFNVQIELGSAPVASAGGDQLVVASDAVFLDGSGSFDADGSIVSFQWQQIAGSTINVENADQQVANFVAPQVNQNTDLAFRLMVTDDSGLSTTDELIITVSDAPSNPPTARILTDNTTVAEGVLLNLLGVGTDPDGDITRIDWTQFAGREGLLGTAETTNGQAFITFIAPILTQFDCGLLSLPPTEEELNDINYLVANCDRIEDLPPPALVEVVLRMTVVDEDNDFDTNDIRLQVYPFDADPPDNIIPTARTLENQRVTAGDIVNLPDFGSSDSDGKIVSYSWEQVGGVAVELTGSNTPLASFIAPNVTVDQLLTFQLTVTDDDGTTDDRRMRIVVAPPLGG